MQELAAVKTEISEQKLFLWKHSMLTKLL